jgi:hypothetical protein
VPGLLNAWLVIVGLPIQALPDILKSRSKDEKIVAASSDLKHYFKSEDASNSRQE